MFYLIDETGQIAGLSTIALAPGGWLAVEGPDASRDDLYYDGTAIQFKPDRPSDTSYWDHATNTWQEPPPPPPPPVLPNWGAMADSLVADIAILAILATNPLFPALVGRLQTLRNGGAMGDPEPLIALWNHHSYSFSEEQVDTINQLTAQNNIPLVLSDGGVLSPTASP
jgi:hypothetical protein